MPTLRGQDVFTRALCIHSISLSARRIEQGPLLDGRLSRMIPQKRPDPCPTLLLKGMGVEHARMFSVERQQALLQLGIGVQAQHPLYAILKRIVTLGGVGQNFTRAA